MERALEGFSSHAGVINAIKRTLRAWKHVQGGTFSRNFSLTIMTMLITCSNVPPPPLPPSLAGGRLGQR